MKRGLISLILALVAGDLSGTDVREFVKVRNTEVVAMANSIVADLYEEKINSAFAKLKSVVIGMSENDLNKFQMTWTTQNETIARLYGLSVGLDLLTELNIGDSFVRLDYLIRHERNGIHVLLVFYKAPDGWGVTSINFDDNMMDLFPLRSLPDLIRVETVPENGLPAPRT